MKRPGPAAGSLASGRDHGEPAARNAELSHVRKARTIGNTRLHKVVRWARSPLSARLALRQRQSYPCARQSRHDQEEARFAHGELQRNPIPITTSWDARRLLTNIN